MVNRDEMIAYLLDEMSEADRAAFVDRWFTDPELYEQLLMAEADLLDEYARGGLRGRQRRQVEKSLLASNLQRDKLRFATFLRDVLPEPKTMSVPWAWIAAALLLISTGLSIWLGLENSKLQSQIAKLQASVPPPVSGLLTLDVPADTFRGASAESTAKLAAGVSVLRLELELRPGDESLSYSATVSAGNRTVWTEGPVRPEALSGAYVARVWIPAALLAPGEYSVNLAAPGRPPAYYRFALRSGG